MRRHLTKLLFASALIVLVAAVACGGSDDAPLTSSDDTDPGGAAPDESIQVQESVEIELDTDGAVQVDVDDDVTGDIFAVDIINFQHQSITVEVGTTVKWTNQDQAPHTVTSGKPGDQSDLFDTRNLGNKGMFSFTFNQEGEIAYFCRIHPSMTATITVVSDLSSVEIDTTEEQDLAAIEATAEAMAAEHEDDDADGEVMVSGDDEDEIVVTTDDAMAVPDGDAGDAPGGDAKVAEHVVSSSIVGNKLQDLTIEVGTAIEWKNDDQIGHTSTFGVPGEPDAGDLWDSGTLILDKTFTYTFDEEGEFVYFCRFHPSSMRATITVVAAGAATQAATDEAGDEVADDSGGTGDSGGDGEAVKVTDEVTIEIQLAAEPEPVSADIINFRHQDLTVDLGTTVTWTNRDGAPHTVTSGTPQSPDGIWDSPFLNQGDDYSFTFDESGEFVFYCRVHPSMTATITVVQ